jgi:acyl-CoA synthetase (NDP forming)
MTASYRPGTEHYLALFEPRGVVVAGASTHPGKFGFVALHNILASGFEGRVFPTNRDGGEILGVPTLTDLDDVPDGEADLVFVCTPASTNPGLLQQAAKKGIRAAFIASAGYGEAGEEGQRAQDDLVALAADLDMLVVGPNGQGVVSTPAKLCAQIVAPFPPAGAISVVSQSGNFVSSFENYALASGVGIARAVSCGNAAQVGVPDFLEFFADDPETDVALAYVEGVVDGRGFFERLEAVCEQMPVVLVKGGATSGGARAAASHTGSLATDDRVFDGMCRQAGAVRAATIEEAYELAASFATQPLPKGPNVIVVSTAGGWGVVTADALSQTDLSLLAMPDDLLADLDTKLPPRWSRNNPVDMAGGETKDTIPDVLATAARHPDVDAVVFLGMGIQGNTAKMERASRFYPDHGLERIVNFHERQDRRYTTAASELITELDKPVLTATELAVTSPDNAAVQGVVDSGRYCYPSSNRAVNALARLWQYSRWRQRRGL